MKNNYFLLSKHSIACIVLIIAIILNFLPINVMGYTSYNDINTANNTTNTNQNKNDSLNDVYLVAEDYSKRNMFEKHYLCSDGSFIAISYPEAVHYQDDKGNWVDVNLGLDFNQDQDIYKATSGKYRVSFKIQETENNYQDIKSTNVLTTEYNSMISMECGNHMLSWGLLANKSTKNNNLTVSTRMNENIVEEERLMATTHNIKVLGKIHDENNYSQSSEVSKLKLNDIDSFNLPYTTNQVKYDSVFGEDEGVSVRYTVAHNKIEEDIILTKKTDITSFSMTVEAGALNAVVNDDNSVDFIDETGIAIYHIGIPYMVDADFEVLHDIEVTLTQNGNVTIITYTPDNEWLSSDERVYPIMLDPSITTNEYCSNIEDTYVEEGNTTDHSSEQYLPFTKNGDNRRRVIVRIRKLPEIDHSMPIISAKLSLNTQYVPFSEVYLTAKYSHSTSSLSSYTYGKTNQINYSFESYGYLFTSGTQVTFDFTKNISEMYRDQQENTAYYGDIVIGYGDADDTTFSYPFISSECETTSLRPTLTVKYGYFMPSELLNGSVYSFKNVGSSKYMSVTGLYPADNSNIYQIPVTSDIPTTSQQFKLEYVENTGGYLLRSMSSTGGCDKVVDIQTTTGYITNGQNVQIHAVDDPISQEWLIIPVSFCEFRIVPRSNMSLALTSVGNATGSSSGNTSTSSGNIIIDTLDIQNTFQKWYIKDSSNQYVYSDMYGTGTASGDYYFVNEYISKYLRVASYSANCMSGTISSLDNNTITWTITNLGNGYYTIQNYTGYFLYQKANSNEVGLKLIYNNDIPNNCLWSLSIASHGGCLIQNKESQMYLYAQNSTINPVSVYLASAAGEEVDSSDYKRRTWFVCDKEEYGELSSQTSFADMNMDKNDVAEITINKRVSSGDSFSDVDDFVYTSLSTNISINNSTQRITALQEVSAKVTATHKLSNQTFTFTVYIYPGTIDVYIVASKISPENAAAESFFGHGWIQIYNNTCGEIQIGAYQLAQNSVVAIGRWGNKIDGVDSEFLGVWYDREYYEYRENNKYQESIYVKTTVSKQKISDINQYLADNYAGYNFLTNNCVDFAMDLWNVVVDDDMKIDSGELPIDSPNELYNYIVDTYPDDYSYNNLTNYNKTECSFYDGNSVVTFHFSN